MKKRFLYAKVLSLLCIGLISQNLIAQQNTAWSTSANIGIGTTTVPSSPVRLNITAASAGASGLRFGNLNSSSSAGANSSGKLLTLNGSGDVILANAVTSVGLTMPPGFAVANSPVTGSGTLAVTTTLNGLLRGNGSGFVVGTAATADIANSAVTYAKMQNVTSGRLLGRAAAGSGVTQEISVGSGLILSLGGALSGINIYNSDGTISGPRVVNYDPSIGNTLEFRSTGGEKLILADGIDIRTSNGGITLYSDGGDISLDGTGYAVTQTAELISLTATTSNLNLTASNGIINATAGTVSLNPVSGVGVGTTTPNTNAKLDVRGNLYCNSKIFIGTADASTATKISSYALAVNGDAICNRVRVKLYANWPDYVFDKTYQLLPLNKLEEYIQKEKHLPGVTTAAEAEAEGIDIATTQQQLLKKIEELTLYVIQQDKKLKELETNVKDLQNISTKK